MDNLESDSRSGHQHYPENFPSRALINEHTDLSPQPRAVVPFSDLRADITETGDVDEVNALAESADDAIANALLNDALRIFTRNGP